MTKQTAEELNTYVGGAACGGSATEERSVSCLVCEMFRDSDPVRASHMNYRINIGQEESLMFVQTATGNFFQK